MKKPRSFGWTTSSWGKPKKQKEHVQTVAPPSDLLNAINNRQVVSFTYDGLSRVVEPHACGVFENGRTVLIGYQTGGQTKSADEPPWRTFSVEKIHDLIMTKQGFPSNREDYNPNDQRLSPVYAKV